MSMKQYLLAALASFLLTAQPSFADTAIGVVNVAKIMQDSKAATSVRSQFQAKQKSFQADLDAKEKDLLAEDQALVKQKDKIEKAAFDEKVKAFLDKQATVKKQVQDKKIALDKSLSGSIEEIQKAVLDIVKQLAAERKLTTVVSTTAVLYADPSQDLTDEVMKRLDAKLPTVAVKF